MAKSASTVWLLDDDPSVLKANGRLLASAGWEVERFIDPDAFLRHAEIHHPRVVVIDMWMPRMDGLEVQRRLSEISPSTRVIVLTANDDRIVRWKALAAGAAAFFIKPECGDEFLAGVRSAFAANCGIVARGGPTKSDFSEALPFGRLWYGEPNSVCNAIGYAKFYSRSHESVIRVFEPGHNRGDDLPADDTQLPSVGL